MINEKTFLFAAVLFSLTALLYSQTAADFEVKGKMLTRYKGTATSAICAKSFTQQTKQTERRERIQEKVWTKQ